MTDVNVVKHWNEEKHNWPMERVLKLVEDTKDRLGKAKQRLDTSGVAYSKALDKAVKANRKEKYALIEFNGNISGLKSAEVAYDYACTMLSMVLLPPE